MVMAMNLPRAEHNVCCPCECANTLEFLVKLSTGCDLVSLGPAFKCLREKKGPPPLCPYHISLFSKVEDIYLVGSEPRTPPEPHEQRFISIQGVRVPVLYNKKDLEICCTIIFMYTTVLYT